MGPELTLIKGGLYGLPSPSKVKHIMNTGITLLRLSSGEELITNVTAASGSQVTIEDTIAVVFQPGPDGQATLAFAPFLPYVKGATTVNVSAVTMHAVPTDNLLAEYKRIFSPIIQPNPPGLLLG